MTAFWSIYESLCEERNLAPISQIQAERIGATRAGIASWKTKGIIPRVETLTAIAEEFGVSIDYLVGRTDVPGTASEMTDRTGRLALPRPIAMYYALSASDQRRVDAFMEGLLASDEYEGEP